ncbi:hypothetical protein CNYM01_05495 [Colletotrichum nymphaeae SA-01]|uniref:Uncharacterized protein n=1 Tax=Colletotrichum nymphaeae SA-01 TaxID=1460502 RepID=A0A135SYN2_9PEZI|nr:hypothetical protein CNYM01_05495 [Colletotrichum nymphaeae SA-01]
MSTCGCRLVWSKYAVQVNSASYPSSSFFSSWSLRSLVSNNRGTPDCENGTPSRTIFAKPLAVNKMNDMPCPLNPAQINCPGFEGTGPTWGYVSFVYYAQSYHHSHPSNRCVGRSETHPHDSCPDAVNFSPAVLPPAKISLHVFIKIMSSGLDELRIVPDVVPFVDAWNDFGPSASHDDATVWPRDLVVVKIGSMP